MESEPFWSEKGTYNGSFGLKLRKDFDYFCLKYGVCCLYCSETGFRIRPEVDLEWVFKMFRYLK